ncbi:unnamed protein product [Amoebophrya sp. A120]|nr:unnamed protein product [Amoebophrya sp. A120]|eukprot:GSA120T00008483001.1
MSTAATPSTSAASSPRRDVDVVDQRIIGGAETLKKFLQAVDDDDQERVSKICKEKPRGPGRNADKGSQVRQDHVNGLLTELSGRGTKVSHSIYLVLAESLRRICDIRLYGTGRCTDGIKSALDSDLAGWRLLLKIYDNDPHPPDLNKIPSTILVNPLQCRPFLVNCIPAARDPSLLFFANRTHLDDHLALHFEDVISEFSARGVRVNGEFIQELLEWITKQVQLQELRDMMKSPKLDQQHDPIKQFRPLCLHAADLLTQGLAPECAAEVLSVTLKDIAANGSYRARGFLAFDHHLLRAFVARGAAVPIEVYQLTLAAEHQDVDRALLRSRIAIEVPQRPFCSVMEYHFFRIFDEIDQSPPDLNELVLKKIICQTLSQWMRYTSDEQMIISLLSRFVARGFRVPHHLYLDMAQERKASILLPVFDEDPHCPDINLFCEREAEGHTGTTLTLFFRDDYKTMLQLLHRGAQSPKNLGVEAPSDPDSMARLATDSQNVHTAFMTEHLKACLKAAKAALQSPHVNSEASSATSLESGFDPQAFLSKVLTALGQELFVDRLKRTVPRAQGRSAAAIGEMIRFALIRFYTTDLARNYGGMICTGPEALSVVYRYLVLQAQDDKSGMNHDDAVFLLCQQLLQSVTEYGWGLAACAPGSIAMILTLLQGRVKLATASEDSAPLPADMQEFEKLLRTQQTQDQDAVREEARARLLDYCRRGDIQIKKTYDAIASGEEGSCTWGANSLRGLFFQALQAEFAHLFAKVVPEPDRYGFAAMTTEAGQLLLTVSGIAETFTRVMTQEWTNVPDLLEPFLDEGTIAPAQ